MQLALDSTKKKLSRYVHLKVNASISKTVQQDPGRTANQEQEEISPNYVQIIFHSSVIFTSIVDALI